MLYGKSQSQTFCRNISILFLTAAFRSGSDDPGWFVSDLNRCLHLVAMLPSGTARASATNAALAEQPIDGKARRMIVWGGI
jgi:hypothetical protein